MVEVRGVKNLGHLNIEPPPSKQARVETIENVVDLPSSTSSELESSVPTTTKQSLSADSYSHTPRASRAMSPSGPSPDIQVCVASITGVGGVVIGM